MLRGSVKQKLLLMISVLILISVSAATILSDRSYRNDLIAQSTQSTRQLLEQLSINLDTYIDELFRLCLSPYYNKRVMEQLESTPTTAAEKLNKQRSRRLSGRSNDPSAKRLPSGRLFSATAFIPAVKRA